MDEKFIRTAALIGDAGMERIFAARVAIFGIGGVGGYVAEALARSGISKLDLIDADTVSVSNINRQIIATEKTVGKSKTALMKERILDINGKAEVRTFELFFSEETADVFDFSEYDYVIDAIDTVKSKLELAERCRAAGVPLISSMGTGNKLDPTKLEITDISKTSVCPLARVMRAELRRRGINHLKVLYSKEIPIHAVVSDSQNGRHSPASSAFVPPAAGLAIAAEVVRDIAFGRVEKGGCPI